MKTFNNKNKPINVLSLFDGISCARIAFEKANISVENYYASEIDKYAIQISAKNYPDIIQLGNVKQIKTEKLYQSIDLLVGGSPCTDLSIARKNRQGLNGTQSCLFYEYVRILKETKSKYFIFENVNSMSKKSRKIITQELFGIEPICINASLVSAQNRKRLFWIGLLQENGEYKKVNIPQPEDKGILLKDILQQNVEEKYYLSGSWEKWLQSDKGKNRIKKGFIKINPNKAKCLMARDYANWSGNFLKQIGFIKSNSQGNRIYDVNGGGWGAKTGLYKENERIRKLTPIEYERLMGLPDNYTHGISDTQRYKCLGNAFHVDVIAHILSFANFE